jgi:hypothetical protein
MTSCWVELGLEMAPTRPEAHGPTTTHGPPSVPGYRGAPRTGIVWRAPLTPRSSPHRCPVFVDQRELPKERASELILLPRPYGLTPPTSIPRSHRCRGRRTSRSPSHARRSPIEPPLVGGITPTVRIGTVSRQWGLDPICLSIDPHAIVGYRNEPITRAPDEYPRFIAVPVPLPNARQRLPLPRTLEPHATFAPSHMQSLASRLRAGRHRQNSRPAVRTLLVLPMVG